MSELKQISPENKERLVKLVNKTASYVNEGMDPTAALTKAASEGEYPADYVLRAAEAYNGAAHLSYFKSANTEERGNSFPLADGAAAAGGVLNSTDIGNKKAENPAFSYVSEPNSYFNSDSVDDSFLFVEKKASHLSFLEVQRSADALGKREKLAVESYRNRYNEACESLASSVKHFREKTATATAHRRSYWAREMLERHGKVAVDIISLATAITGDECIKLANDRTGYFSLADTELNSLDSIIRGFNQTRFLSTKLAQAEHDVYVNSLERSALLDTLSGVKKSYGLDLSFDSFTKELNPGMGSPSDSTQKGLLESLADPDFVDRSSRIDRALKLHKLIKSDPIIGSKPAREIEQALSEINSIAPYAAKSEPLLRSMLRRRLEAGEQIDDFSLNQMLNMEDKMREQHKEYSVVPKLTGVGGESVKKDK